MNFDQLLENAEELELFQTRDILEDSREALNILSTLPKDLITQRDHFNTNLVNNRGYEVSEKRFETLFWNAIR